MGVNKTLYNLEYKATKEIQGQQSWTNRTPTVPILGPVSPKLSFLHGNQESHLKSGELRNTGKCHKNATLVDIVTRKKRTEVVNASDLPQIYLLITTARPNNGFTGMENTLINRSSMARKLIQYAPRSCIPYVDHSI